jgi:hypothetical protein
VALKADEKAPFIREQLFHELRRLLGAATVWTAFSDAKAGFDVVVAEDSAFVHARCLFEFFTHRKGGNDVSVTEFGPTAPYTSPAYGRWCGPLNRHVLHIAKGRTTPSNLNSSGHLNEQVKVFADEILLLWDKLIGDPEAAAFKTDLEWARAEAVKDARNDAGTRTKPIFT